MSFGGHRYHFSNVSMGRAESKEHCRDAYSYLAEIGSPEEETFLRSMAHQIALNGSRHRHRIG